MKGIVWLTSYPKSGNTWFRTFLTSLINEEDKSPNINELKTNGIFSKRKIFDDIVGFESSNLTFDEIDNLRPEVYENIAERAEKELYIKVHDAYTYLKDGRSIFPSNNEKAVYKAIYIVRNPLDVAVSISFHTSVNFNKMIENMGDRNFCFSGNESRLQNQLRQKLLTWSEHVESWTSIKDIEVLLVRYEDMKEKPLETFSKAVEFIGLNNTKEQIQRAINFSDFDKLKKQEEENGFKEKPRKMDSFFRKGQIGDWREHLTKDQVNKIINDHRKVMQDLGYLTQDGKIVY